MNLEMEKNVNFNTILILIFLMDFKNEHWINNFGPM